jgi:hypothetical protein
VSPQTQGRIAGCVYLAVVVSGIFALAWAPRQLIVPADPVETLANLTSRLRLFQAMIAATVVMAAFFLALPFSLARFLSPAGPRVARLMIGFVALSIPATLLAVMHYGELAVQIAGETVTLESLGDARAGYRRWIGVSTVFWGLWLAPLGWLILRSRSLPRVLGVVLLIGSAGYLVDYFAPMVIQGYGEWSIADWVTLPASIGELGTCAWLLLFGARPPALGSATVSTP